MDIIIKMFAIIPAYFLFSIKKEGLSMTNGGMYVWKYSMIPRFTTYLFLWISAIYVIPKGWIIYKSLSESVSDYKDKFNSSLIPIEVTIQKLLNKPPTILEIYIRFL